MLASISILCLDAAWATSATPMAFSAVLVMTVITFVPQSSSSYVRKQILLKQDNNCPQSAGKFTFVHLILRLRLQASSTAAPQAATARFGHRQPRQAYTTSSSSMQGNKLVE